MTLYGPGATVETRTVPDTLERAVAVKDTIRDQELGMCAQVAHRADHPVVIEDANRCTIAEGDAEHGALREVGDRCDILEVAHVDGASPFSAA